MLFCRSFATDIVSAADDDYDLFADAIKCHSRSAADVPRIELEQELDENKTVKWTCDNVMH